MSPSEEKKGKNRQQPSAKNSGGKKKNKTVKKQDISEHHLDKDAQINGNFKPKLDKKKKKTNDEENNDVFGEMQSKITSRKNREVVTDRRFESLHYDPKFQSVPKQQSKVTIDKRFEGMFTDKSFASSSAPVDKRGKSRKGKSPNPLLNYYINQNDPLKSGESNRLNEFDATLLDDEDEDEDVNEDGKSNGSSSSTSSDEDDYDEQSINSDVAHYMMADHESTSRTEEPTHRLAVVNMDWDRIKAVDIYVTMTSSLPKDGHVVSVNVYPSEFGRECMEIEATQGPSSLIYGNDKKINDSDDDYDSDESEDDYDEAEENEKLRLYELNKLRYYYAVVDCDSSKTANYLYEELDRTELLKTSNVFDLRFIPDSMEFNHPPRETTTEAPINYTPPDFQTRALQHSNVKLTWEEDEPDRKRILKRKFNTKQLEEIESDSLMASDGEESDDEETSGVTNGHVRKPVKKEKYIALLEPSDHSDAEDDDDGQDMEITFNTGLEDIAKRVQDRKGSNSESVWQSYLRKRKEKKIARKKHAKYSSSDDESVSDYDEAVCVNDPGQPDDFFAEESCEVDAKVRKKGNKDTSNTKIKASKAKAQSEDENKEQEASQAELELLCTSNSNKAEILPIADGSRHEKGKGKKKIKKQRTEDKLPKEDYKDDPRFKELFNSHHYALDPTDSQFKRSATYARQMLQKQKKQGTTTMQNKTQRDDQPPDELQPDNDDTTSSKNKDELSSLVRSLKRKTSAFKCNK